jgi:hypothetical protein
MNVPLRSAGLLLLAGGVALLGGSGCGPNTGTKSSGTAAAEAAADPWPKFVSAVRNTPDSKGARGAVADLAGGLTRAAGEQAKAADPAGLEAVAVGLKLTDAERIALGGAEFTPLDANHLSECLYLLDAANALGVTPADPPAVRADAAFRFVCRQVVLHPATIQNLLLPPVPPTYVLARGWGSGLERATVFVALCRQLDLDAYFVGPPAAADQSWTHPGPAAQGQPPKGPFWAVGVRATDGVLVYDPWRGAAVPGKAAGRPATLAELRADPAVCPWLADKAAPWDVTADDIKASGLFLSPPLSALSPRMGRMQDKLKDGVGVRLAVDWAAAVKAAEAVAGGAPVGGWNPKGDKFTPVRVLGSFLPLEQGGQDATPSKDSVSAQYDYARLPIDRVLRTPLAVTSGEAQSTLRGLAEFSFRTAFLTPPTPREKVQRGQYNAAVEHLVKRRDEYEKLRRGQAEGAGESLDPWYQSLNDTFNKATRARGSGEEAAAREEVDKFVRGSGRQLDRVVGEMVAESGVAEATYLLALAAHEQAEAAEVAAAREGAAADARKAATGRWAKAAGGWRKYAEYAAGQEASFPGRKANADALAARADGLAK